MIIKFIIWLLSVVFGYACFCNPSCAVFGKVDVNIVCWGDSLTAGAGKNFWEFAYPDVLRNDIFLYEHKRVNVVNMGAGGEDTLTICARAGVNVPLSLTEQVTLPTGRAKTEISISNKIMRWQSSGVNDCTIGLVKGKISIEQTSPTAENVKYYFTPNVGLKEKVTLSVGTEIVTYAATHYQEYVSVIFIGQNGGWNDDPLELIRQQQTLIDRQTTNQEKFIILGLTSGTALERATLEEKMVAEYGDKYINLREELSSLDRLNSYNVKLKAGDAELLEQGAVPSCLRSDSVHLNGTGYKMIGDLVYNRMKTLGYFK